MAWEIRQLPAAPSANKLHVNVMRRGRIGFRRNSGDYLNFKHQMRVYELANRANVIEIREWAKDRNLSLHFDMYFVKTKLFYKDGRVKKFDHHNLLKAQIDGVAEMLHFDDSLVWEVSASKKVSLNAMNYVDCFLSDISE